MRRGDISLPTEIIAVTVAAAAAAAVVGALRCLLLTAAASTLLTGGSRMLPGKSWVEAKKDSPYSITAERRVPELISVLGSQPAGDVSHKPGVRLPLLSASLQLLSHPFRGLLPISLFGEQRQDCYPTSSRLRYEPRPFCA